jgi:ribosomal protein S18 acetylase RimI-like enzyme
VSPPQLPPAVEPELSWARRRALYEDWLADPDAFCLVAWDGDAPVGYSLVSVHGSEALDDTWAGGERIAEMQTLVVSERARSRGVGALLLRRAESEVVSRGIDEMIIGAVATNDGAVRFYETHGYVPYWVGLYRKLR